mmetsp:Transcript_3566/g.7814  ORF Transcript_3566/g.7814 Transcript_3566/m.7814 type:complete len:91 (+) Transcript_3566:28-300(+)
MSRSIEAKALYKALLRAAQSMPVENRRSMALARIRQDFRESRFETDENNIKDLFMVGYTQLETLTIQANHLGNLMKMDMSAMKGVKNTLT